MLKPGGRFSCLVYQDRPAREIDPQLELLLGRPHGRPAQSVDRDDQAESSIQTASSWSFLQPRIARRRAGRFPRPAIEEPLDTAGHLMRAIDFLLNVNSIESPAAGRAARRRGSSSSALRRFVSVDDSMTRPTLAVVTASFTPRSSSTRKHDFVVLGVNRHHRAVNPRRVSTLSFFFSRRSWPAAFSPAAAAA